MTRYPVRTRRHDNFTALVLRRRMAQLRADLAHAYAANEALHRARVMPITLAELEQVFGV